MYAQTRRSLPFFSPPALFASLQTSTFQARNGTAGAVMTLIKKIDVKNHLASRNRKGIHLFRATVQPGAAGFSGEETASRMAKAKHSIGSAAAPAHSNGSKIAVTEDVAGSTDSLKQVAFRNAQL
jgi:hypothetical protein